MVDGDRFNAVMGDIIVRVDDDPSISRVRMFPARLHSNLNNDLHGSALLAFLDIALFAGAQSQGIPTIGGAVTVDIQVQMVGAGRIGQPLDAVVEVVKEGGKLVFLRGLVEQGDHRVASFSGIIRKVKRIP